MSNDNDVIRKVKHFLCMNFPLDDDDDEAPYNFLECIFRTKIILNFFIH